jgi:hypothetical protein
MKAIDIYHLLNNGRGDRLLDADLIVIPADTYTDDELATEKVRVLLDEAWDIIDKRSYRKGLTRKNDAALKRLVNAFNAWALTAELETTDIWE